MTTTIFLLLALFGIKHFIADFVLQYDYMVREKGIYGAVGGLHHSFVHVCFTFLILIPFCSSVSLLIGLSLLDGILHYHIDWSKQQLNRGLTAADRKFWFYIGLDQLLHYLTYIVIIFYVTA